MAWGYPDPDELGDLLTPELMDGWIAYDVCEPIGQHWEAAGTVAASVVNSMSRYIAARAGKPLEAADVQAPGDFIPRPEWWHESPPAERGLTDEQSEAYLRGLV